MKDLEATFNSSFSHWEIRLPPDALTRRQPGTIIQAGWAIWYLFGSDERGNYLDYYASHRMTNDRHVRIYADGVREGLPTIQEFRLCSRDPEEDASLEREYFAKNQEVAKMLEEKGFGLTGNEPGGVQINRHLHLEKFPT